MVSLSMADILHMRRTGDQLPKEYRPWIQGESF